MKNRDIKFRAWNGFKMVYRGLHDRNWYTDSKSGLAVNPTHPNDKIELIVMESTGLIDKNGAEVYEGDIIKFKTTRYHTEKQKTMKIAMPKLFTSPVLWKDSVFLVNENEKFSLNVDDFDTPLCCFFGESIPKADFLAEVIGNIYESDLSIY